MTTSDSHDDRVVAAALGSAFWQWLRQLSLGALLASTIVALFLGGTASLAVSKRPATYQSTILTLVDQPAALVLSGDAGIVFKLNTLRARYAVLLNTERVTGPVAERLDIDESVVESSLGVTSSEEIPAMRITATASEPELAEAIVVAAAERLSQLAKEEQDAQNIPPVGQVVVDVVGDPTPAAKISPSVRLLVLAGGVTGGVALVATYFLVRLFTERLPSDARTVRAMRRDSTS